MVGVTDAVPGVRDLNVLGQLEVKASLVFACRDPLVQQEQVLLGFQEVGVVFLALTLQAGDPDFNLCGSVLILDSDGSIRRGQSLRGGEG